MLTFIYPSNAPLSRQELLSTVPHPYPVDYILPFSTHPHQYRWSLTFGVWLSQAWTLQVFSTVSSVTIGLAELDPYTSKSDETTSFQRRVRVGSLRKETTICCHWKQCRSCGRYKDLRLQRSRVQRTPEVNGWRWEIEW